MLLQFAQEIGLLPKKTSSTHGGEYHSPCPACGGRDRFFIQPNRKMKNCIGYYQCRQCAKKGDSIQFCIDFLGLTFPQAVQKIGAEIQECVYSTPIERSFIAPILISPSEQWSLRAKDFVLWAHDQILHAPVTLKSLESRGLSLNAVHNYKIGYCTHDLWVNPSEFQIESDKKLFLPEGVVIPTMESSGKIIRLKIRRIKWTPKDQFPKYWAIKGSMNGLNIVGDVAKPLMIIVESELDAYALHHAVNDLLFVVAVGSNTKNPDYVVDYWAKRRCLLICHDNDEGGLAMNEKWKQLYLHAGSAPVPIEKGKDIGEAVANGLDLRAWIKSLIKNKIRGKYA